MGFIVGTWAAYLLNRRWTFQAKATAVNFAVQRWIFRKAGVRGVAKQDPS
ncbi:MULTISPECIES: hypothetical protein [unclassified Corynebacterium]|nr:hypothetical protein [Corynebacterium sp. MSK195]MDK8670296.1 hypothetical protein [Corynebacterium sp. MSK195]